MDSNFSRFIKLWKDALDKSVATGSKSLSDSTVSFLIAKEFGPRAATISHYKKLAVSFGFASKNENNFYLNNSVINKIFKECD